MKTKDITLIAMFSALLLGAQLALSMVSGVEVVSLLLAAFCAVFGVKRGAAVAVVFSLLRCIVFGLYPTVIILYLLYYPLYALVLSLCGKLKGWSRYGLATAVAVVMTALFTLLDDAITPLVMGFTAGAAKAYFVASLPVMLAHVICVAATMLLLFIPIAALFDKLKLSYYNE